MKLNQAHSSQATMAKRRTRSTGHSSSAPSVVVQDNALQQDILAVMQEIGLENPVQDIQTPSVPEVSPTSSAAGSQRRKRQRLAAEVAAGPQSTEGMQRRHHEPAGTTVEHATFETRIPSKPFIATPRLPELPVPVKALLRDEDLQAEHWYEAIPAAVPPLKSSCQPKASEEVAADIIRRLEETGLETLRAVSQLYHERKQRHVPSRTPLSGPELASLPALGAKQLTLMDRIATLAMDIRRAPLYYLDELTQLIDLATTTCKKRRKERWTAIEALKELFIEQLLPPSRKLCAFQQRDWATWYAEQGAQLVAVAVTNERTSQAPPSMTATERAQVCSAFRVLMFSAFESAVKAQYARFLVEALTDSAQDPIEFLATRALGAALDLLVACPEQEQALLDLLVTKLGSTHRALSSKAYHSLELLIQKHHPAMRLVVARHILQLGIESLPNLTTDRSNRLLYLCVRFLAHVMLHRDRPGDRAFAATLLSFYLGTFRILLERQRFDSRLCTAVLEGLQRVLPFIPEGISNNNNRDNSDFAQQQETLKNQIDGLYLLVHRGNLETSIRSLMVLYRLGATDRFYRALYETLASPRLWYAAGSRITALCNICYWSMKADTCVSRLLALVKRLLSLALQAPAATAAGILLMLSELIFRSGQEAFRLDAQKQLLRIRQALGEGSSEERVVAPHQRTAPRTFEATPDQVPSTSLVDAQTVDARASVVRTAARQESASNWTTTTTTTTTTYDMSKREPKFAGAEAAAWCELALLRCHYQPTVAAFAEALIQGQAIHYKGDPLEDHAHAAFLDRLVRKKPKSSPPIARMHSAFAEPRSLPGTPSVLDVATGRTSAAPESTSREGAEVRHLHTADAEVIPSMDKAPNLHALSVPAAERSPRGRTSIMANGMQGAPQQVAHHLRIDSLEASHRSTSADESSLAHSSDDEEEQAIWAAMEDSLAKQGMLLSDDDDDDDDELLSSESEPEPESAIPPRRAAATRPQRTSPHAAAQGTRALGVVPTTRNGSRGASVASRSKKPSTQRKRIREPGRASRRVPDRSKVPRARLLS